MLPLRPDVDFEKLEDSTRSQVLIEAVQGTDHISRILSIDFVDSS